MMQLNDIFDLLRYPLLVTIIPFGLTPFDVAQDRLRPSIPQEPQHRVHPFVVRYRTTTGVSKPNTHPSIPQGERCIE